MSNQFLQHEDTIVALSTPPGVSAIAVIRLSGKSSIEIVSNVFKGKDLTKQASHTIHFGKIHDNGVMIDEVLISLFIAPASYTKENSVEISTHGSPYIVRRVMELLVRQGARYALPGEFTKRAFLNGQLDLAQAEAVADLIHSDSEASHKAAITQMRGGISKEIEHLREKLIQFASLIELELDFSEEDVEFADRQQLAVLIETINKAILKLIESFSLGNVLKEGIATVIAGKPNAGKSTLLNALLKEEKAIVSDIEGTTRDYIEDEMVIEGLKFRFIDTAGLREANDAIEAMGVARTKEKMIEAALILYLFDINTMEVNTLKAIVEELKQYNKPFLLIGNKIDKGIDNKAKFEGFENSLFISAATHEFLDELKTTLINLVEPEQYKSGDTMVTSMRHYESLINTKASLEKVLYGVNSGISGDFLALDIRQALHHLGSITGAITTEDLLESIFSKFCIGK